MLTCLFLWGKCTWLSPWQVRSSTQCLAGTCDSWGCHPLTLGCWPWLHINSHAPWPQWHHKNTNFNEQHAAWSISTRVCVMCLEVGSLFSCGYCTLGDYLVIHVFLALHLNRLVGAIKTMSRGLAEMITLIFVILHVIVNANVLIVCVFMKPTDIFWSELNVCSSLCCFITKPTIAVICTFTHLQCLRTCISQMHLVASFTCETSFYIKP